MVRAGLGLEGRGTWQQGGLRARCRGQRGVGGKAEAEAAASRVAGVRKDTGGAGRGSLREVRGTASWEGQSGELRRTQIAVVAALKGP